jgi:hypothetical protein
LIERSNILDPVKNILKNGALCVDVAIQVKEEEDEMYSVERTHANSMLILFRSGGKTDISFKVGSKTFHAHSLILHANAPTLASLCDGQSDQVVIKKVHSQFFEVLLEYIYSGQPPAKDS